MTDIKGLQSALLVGYPRERTISLKKKLEAIIDSRAGFFDDDRPLGRPSPAASVLTIRRAVNAALYVETKTMKQALVDGSVVTRLRALHPESIPENLRQKAPTKAAADFDPNTYFTVLNHLKMKDGYTLDYVYLYMKNFGGNPCLYARPTDAKPFDTLVEHGDWAEKNNLLSYLVADGTADGFFQLAVFRRLAGQFYLYWHANYNDMTIITSSEDVETTVKALNGKRFGAKLTEAQVTAFRAIPPEPSVAQKDTTADVTYCVFTKWGGITRLKETFRRSPPHMIVGRDVLDAVKYMCGVRY